MQLFRIIISLTLIYSYFNVIAQNNKEYILYEKTDFDFPYQIDNPDNTWKLPKSLIEISGLSYIDNNKLAGVQDEKGNIYIYNLKKKEVKLTIDFGDGGDYEGIEIVKNDAWILKSNGTLYKVNNYLKKENPKTKKYSTSLSGRNDTEGLAYDPITKDLLIACKGHPFIYDKNGKEFKAIYSFNLETKQIDPNPFLLIVLDSVKALLNYNTMSHLGIELLAYFDPSKGDISFQPSGIAIHPLSGYIYIIGSVGNLLLIYNRSGDMLAMIKLRSKYFTQPEGICFSPEGDLYISNEGGDKKGTILKYKLRY